jgi:hypothetical protein
VNAALATPTVTFTGAPAQAAYLSSFTIAATTNASTTAVISASGPCSISGSLVTVTAGSGTCSLAANWLADMNYTSATANQSTVATKGATVVTVTNVNPASESYGSATPTVVTATLTWSANSGAAPTGGLTFKSTGSGPFVGSPSCSSTNSTTLTCTQTFKPAAPSAPVTYTLSASYSGDANYNSASSTQTNNFMITQQTPTVSITSVTPSSEAYGSGTPTQVTASLSWSGSGAAPTAKAALLNFSSTGAGAFGPVVCSGSNPKSCQVQFTPTATDKVSGYTITASYAGDRNYTAAHSTQTGNFTITPDTPAVTVTPNPATITHGSTAPVTLTATFTGVGANDAAPSGTVKFGAGSGTFSGQTCSSSGDVLTCTVSYTPSGKLAVGTYNNYLAASITAAGDYKAVTGYANLVVIK